MKPVRLIQLGAILLIFGVVLLMWDLVGSIIYVLNCSTSYCTDITREALAGSLILAIMRSSLSIIGAVVALTGYLVRHLRP